MASRLSNPDYLSPEHVAALIDMPRRSVVRLIKAGKLPAVKIGRLYRVPRKSLEACLRVSA